MQPRDLSRLCTRAALLFPYSPETEEHLPIRGRLVRFVTRRFSSGAPSPVRLPIASVLLLVQECSQSSRPRPVTQLAQCLGFNLADSLTRHIKLVSDFLQRVICAAVNAKPQAQNFRFARRQSSECLADRIPHAGMQGSLGRQDGRDIF